MTNIVENIDNEYVLTAIIAIRENDKRLDIKAIKEYIDKNLEEELIESIVIELLDHNKIENRPTPRGNSYLLEKRIILQ